MGYPQFKDRLSSHSDQRNVIATPVCWTPSLNEILELDAVKKKSWKIKIIRTNRRILKMKNKMKGLIPPIILNVPKIYFILTYSDLTKSIQVGSVWFISHYVTVALLAFCKN